MARNEDIEIPGEDDENVGEGAPVKKREKRRKSKEERVADRKVIFWTLLIVFLITWGFWMMPRIKSFFNGEPATIKNENKDQAKPSLDKSEKKNYVEITL